MILRLIEPEGLEVKQILLDECEDEICAKVKGGGKYADELVVLPSGEIIVVECAKRPKARDATQAIETFRKLVKAGKKVVAIVVAGEEGFDKRDESIIAAALKAVYSKYRVETYLRRSGQILHLKKLSVKFEVRCQ